MNIYKLIFANNDIISCDLLPNVALGKEYYYEHDKGKLIHILLRAESEADALAKSDKII